jgi:hypothetical protein
LGGIIKKKKKKKKKGTARRKETHFNWKQMMSGLVLHCSTHLHPQLYNKPKSSSFSSPYSTENNPM